MNASSLILQACKREVRSGQQWLKEHRRDCVPCARSGGRNSVTVPCATGVRIERYIDDNQAIVERMSAAPVYEQPALFDLSELGDAS